MIVALPNKKNLLLTLLLCLAVGARAQNGPARDAHDIGHFMEINNDIRFYFDTSGTLPLEKVIQARNTDRLKHLFTVFFCVRNVAGKVLHYDSSGINP